MIWVLTALAGAGTACAQDFPGKPIRLITGGAGGSIDFMARLIAQGISGPLGQAVVIDNRANVVIAAETVSKAPPDGYSLLVYGNPFWIGPLIQKAPYDPLRDFSAITWAGSTPNIIVVHPSLAAKSVAELIALAKTRPGTLDYAASGIGGAGHLAAELFNFLAGVKLQHINYKSSGQAINDLLGGHVQLMFATGASVAPHLGSGRLRALAVTTAQPSQLFPGLPTVAATLPGYEAVLIVGVFAPARTPAAIVGRLNEEIVRALRTTEIKEKFLGSGSEVVASSPEQLAATVKSEMENLGRMIKDLGIRAE